MATMKQKRAVQLLMENHGNVSKSMREAGYTDASAKNPKNLTESAGFRELLEAYLPDDMLLRALSDDIENKVANRKQELELAFKLKGKMVEKQDITSNGETIAPVLVQFLNNDTEGNTDTSGV